MILNEAIRQPDPDEICVHCAHPFSAHLKLWADKLDRTTMEGKQILVGAVCPTSTFLGLKDIAAAPDPMNPP